MADRVPLQAMADHVPLQATADHVPLQATAEVGAHPAVAADMLRAVVADIPAVAVDIPVVVAVGTPEAGATTEV